jgi:hypothetical protein
MQLSSTFRNIRTASRGRHRYRVTNAFSLRDLIVMLAAMAAIVAVTVVISAVLKVGVAVLGFFLLALPARWYIARRTGFGITAETVIVAGVHAHWDHVEEVVMISHPNGETTFAVFLDEEGGQLLRPGPDASGFHLSHITARPVDHRRLRVALARYGPACVTFTGFGPLDAADAEPEG